MLRIWGYTPYNAGMNRELADLYADYLLSSFGQTTATGLSSLVGGQISHDKVTRFLSGEDFGPKDLWRLVKRDVRSIELDDAVLIFDDTVQEKMHTDENELICWHYDHTKGRSVKGINLVNCLYHSQGVSIPVNFELVKKPYQFSDIKTKRIKRKGDRTKNEMVRDMLLAAKQQHINYRYVLFDSWFSASETLSFIVENMNKHFVSAVKANRLVAIKESDKHEGKFVAISDLDYSSQSPVQVWVKGLKFPVLVHRQVFTNKDGSKGVLYLICSDLDCDKEAIEAIYKKRWKVEIYHKTMKQNANLAKSPTKRVRTQANHIFMAVYATFKLECLSVKKKLNHFALKSKLLVSATRSAYEQLQAMKAA
jgi:hypothetical protein